MDLFVYDLASGQSTRMDVRDGKPFTDDVVGHYVYQIVWTPDGSEITFNRTNRRQNVLEFTACASSTGDCQVVVPRPRPLGAEPERMMEFFIESLVLDREP